MKTWFPQKIVKAMTPSIIGLILIYFCYHAVQGNYGVLSWLQLEKQHENALQVFEAFNAERQSLETKVQLMSTSIDLDLLDQQVRLLLGYASPDELILLKTADENSTHD